MASNGITSFLFQGDPIPPQPTGSDTSSSYPLWLQDYTYNLANAASNLASTPYQAYGGPTVAAPSATTLQAQQLAASNVGNYQPYLQQAGALTQAAGTPLTGQQIQQYMNPFENTVIGGIESSLNTNLNQNVLPGIQDRFVTAGQSRSPQEMQATNNAVYQNQQAIGQQVGSALETGYNGALQEANAQQTAQQQAGAQLGTLGSLTQALGQGDVASLAASGQQQDTLAQNNINAAMNAFYQQQQYPYQQLGFASNIIRGLPVNTNQQTSGVTYQNSGYTASPLASLGQLALGSGVLARGGRVSKRRIARPHPGALAMVA
jgi:hypothetical protein